MDRPKKGRAASVVLTFPVVTSDPLVLYDDATSTVPRKGMGPHNHPIGIDPPMKVVSDSVFNNHILLWCDKFIVYYFQKRKDR